MYKKKAYGLSMGKIKLLALILVILLIIFISLIYRRGNKEVGSIDSINTVEKGSEKMREKKNKKAKHKNNFNVSNQSSITKKLSHKEEIILDFKGNTENIIYPKLIQLGYDIKKEEFIGMVTIIDYLKEKDFNYLKNIIKVSCKKANINATTDNLKNLISRINNIFDINKIRFSDINNNSLKSYYKYVAAEINYNPKIDKLFKGIKDYNCSGIYLKNLENNIINNYPNLTKFLLYKRFKNSRTTLIESFLCNLIL